MARLTADSGIIFPASTVEKKALMVTINAYHRPTSLEEILELLAWPDSGAVLLGGGTEIDGFLGGISVEIVDLQAFCFGVPCHR